MHYPDLTKYNEVCLDLETTGLAWWKDKIFGVALSLPDGTDHYWDVRESPNTIQWLRDQFHKVPVFVNHNAKFDANFLLAAGVKLPKRIECTMVRAALIDEHLLKYDLDYLGKKYVGVGKVGDIYADLARLFGGAPTRSVQMKNLHRAPSTIVGPYAKQDTRTAFKLWQWQNGEIKRQGLERVVELETELLPVIIDMEQGGVRVDVDRAERAVADISKILDRDQRELDREAGFAVNFNPSSSIHKLFEPKKNEEGKWVLIDGTIADSTEAGKASINADCLRRMKHPLATNILKMRKLAKAKDTFLRGHVLGHQHNGVVHCNINQTKGDNDAGTVSGRLSINSPALQQIPARDKEVKALLRPCFLPDAGKQWLGIDWSAFEFRVFGHYLNDDRITKQFLNDPNTDFHQVVADLTGIPRNAQYVGGPSAKAINLAQVFGAGPGKAAEMIGLPYTVEKYESRGKVKEFLKPGPEAEEIFKKYHTAVPGVRDLLERAASVARSRGYVVTALGRHIRFPGGQFTHKAGGLIFQGTSADAMKSKLIAIDKICKQHGDARLILTVHDEIGVSVPPGDEEVVKEIVHEYTRFDGTDGRIKFRIPITCEWGVGNNWFEAKD